MQAAGEIREGVDRINRQINELRSLSQPPSRSAHAEAVYSMFTQYADGKPIKLSQLRQAVQHMEDRDFWKALQELWEQQWVNITLE
jgi:hypothetical protein